jgi:hypothetical protein
MELSMPTLGPVRVILSLTSLAFGVVGCSSAQANRDSVTVRLEPVGNSGISGAVTATARGRETDFATTLKASSEADRRREFDVRIRAGTCSAPGRVIEDIDDIKADGRTEREDEDVRLSDLQQTSHIVEVTVEDRDQVVACGEIPRR